MNDRVPVTSIEATENLDHPLFDLADGETSMFGGVGDDGGEVSTEELEDEDGVLVFLPEVLVQDDDVWEALEHLESLDFSEGGLVVVNLLESHREVVGETAAVVDVGVSSGADPVHDLVLGGDLGSGMDAPALGSTLHLTHFSFFNACNLFFSSSFASSTIC